MELPITCTSVYYPLKTPGNFLLGSGGNARTEGVKFNASRLIHSPPDCSPRFPNHPKSSLVYPSVAARGVIPFTILASPIVREERANRKIEVKAITPLALLRTADRSERFT